MGIFRTRKVGGKNPYPVGFKRQYSSLFRDFGDIKIFSHAKPEIIAEQMKKEIALIEKK